MLYTGTQLFRAHFHPISRSYHCLYTIHLWHLFLSRMMLGHHVNDCANAIIHIRNNKTVTPCHLEVGATNVFSFVLPLPMQFLMKCIFECIMTWSYYFVIMSIGS